MKVFTSPFTNPFINLALEDYFLRAGADLPVLFFYVNRPCVVMGRFQNPWIETNLPYLAANDIWLVRRQSGGGTVFHDLGNLNWSFITPGGMFDRRKHADLLREAFARAQIAVEVSPRNDLWLQGKKVSGSAYKQTKSASFHHGTLLVSSDLGKLEEGLRQTVVPKATKSIASVRSAVTTLSAHYPGIEIHDVIDLVSHFFQTIPFELEATLLSLPEVQRSFTELTSWEWLWGETPHFELEEGLEIRKGIIEGTGKRFERSAVCDQLSQDSLARLFPDFSEQHKSSNLIS